MQKNDSMKSLSKKKLLSKHGVTIMSCAENVCILKEAARLWVECSASVPVDDLL